MSGLDAAVNSPGAGPAVHCTVYIYQVSASNSKAFAHNTKNSATPVHVLHTSRFTGARRAMFGQSVRANATASGTETWLVPSMGPKEPRTALVPYRGA